MSGIQRIHQVSLGTSMQGDIGKQPIIAIAGQQRQGNKGFMSLKDGDTGTLLSKQSRTEVLGKGEENLA